MNSDFHVIIPARFQSSRLPGKLLMDLKGELEFSVLFITHNLSIAKKIADRICVMHTGKIVEEGNREKIFSSPEHFHTKELITAYEKIGKL